MLIDCPACARSYHVSRDDIGAEGRAVICPRCEAQWFVDRDGVETFISSSEELRTTSVSRRPGSRFDIGRPAARRSVGRSITPIFVIAACVLMTMVGLGARARIVRLIPRTAGLYAAVGLPVNVRGLEIVALTPKRLDASSDLTVSGEVRNVAQKRVGVPRLTYEIRNGAGMTLVTWTEHSSARTLGAGKSLPFVSAPHSLPPDAHSVLVRFEDADAAPVRLARHGG